MARRPFSGVSILPLNSGDARSAAGAANVDSYLRSMFLWSTSSSPTSSNPSPLIAGEHDHR